MSVLGAYYRALIQESGSKAAADDQQARLTGAQASDEGANAASQRALQNAQAGADQAGAARQTAEAGQVAPNAATTRSFDQARQSQVQQQTGLLQGTANAENAYRGAQTADSYAHAGAEQAGSGLGMPNPLATSGGSVSGGAGYTGAKPSQGYNQPLAQTQFDAKGGMILPKGMVAQGKSAKPNPSDTVPAMLTPGEAVLNKGAVGHYGSDVIDHMNKMGLMRMGAQSEVAKAVGLPDPHAQPASGKDKAKGGKGGSDAKTPPAGRQGFAAGTPEVKPLPALSPTTLTGLFGGTTPSAGAGPMPPPDARLKALQAMFGGTV